MAETSAERLKTFLFSAPADDVPIKWSARFVMIMAFFAPIVPVFILKSMAPIFIGYGLLAAIAWCVETKRPPVMNKCFAILLGGFLLWCALSILWSINAEASLEKFLKLLLFMAPLAALSGIVPYFRAEHYRAILQALTLGLLCGCGIYLFESVSNFSVFYAFYDGGDKSSEVIQNKTLYMFFLMLFPALYFCVNNVRDKWPMAAAAVLLVLIPYFIWDSQNRSMQLITMMTAIGMAGVLILPRAIMRYGVFFMMILTFLTAPMLAQNLLHGTDVMKSGLSNSFKSRVEIWDMTARRIAEKPVHGWGIKSSPYMPNRGEYSSLYQVPTPIAHLHPHNGVLQMWFELGAVGILFMMGFTFYFMRVISAIQNRVAHNFIVLSIAVAFVCVLPSFGVWQTWFMSTLAVFAFMTLCVKRSLCNQAAPQ